MEEGEKTSGCVGIERNGWTCVCIETIVAAMERNDCVRLFAIIVSELVM